jgi:hypothetical protein
MKDKINLINFASVLLLFFLTGCYTQLQNLEYTSYPNQKKYNNTHSQNSFSVKNKKLDTASDVSPNKKINTAKKSSPENEILDSEIFFKDYETAQWYEDNYADMIYLEGYNQGFSDGYDEGYDDASHDYWDAHSYNFQLRHRRGLHRIGFHYTWRNHIAFTYYPYYYNDPYWYAYNSSFYYWSGSRYATWSFHDPYYDSFFYNTWGYYGRPYRNYFVVYNHNNNGYKKRKNNGIRKSGLISRGNGIQNRNVRRTRNASDINYTKKNVKSRNSIETKRKRTHNNDHTSRYTKRTRTSDINVGSKTRNSNHIRSRNRANDNNQSSVRSKNSNQSNQRSRVRNHNSSPSNRASIRNSNSSSSRSTVKRNSSSSSGKSTIRSSRSNRTSSSASSSSSKRSRSKKNE